MNTYDGRTPSPAPVSLGNSVGLDGSCAAKHEGVNTVELKNCPFCGSNAERKGNKRYRKGYLATVGCKSQLCPAKISQATMRGDVEEAYKFAENVWNTRVEEVAHERSEASSASAART